MKECRYCGMPLHNTEFCLCTKPRLTPTGAEEPCEHCPCRECKHKQVCCWCDFSEREVDEGPEPFDA
jgi:hypothetical protein